MTDQHRNKKRKVTQTRAPHSKTVANVESSDLDDVMIVGRNCKWFAYTFMAHYPPYMLAPKKRSSRAVIQSDLDGSDPETSKRVPNMGGKGRGKAPLEYDSDLNTVAQGAGSDGEASDGEETEGSDPDTGTPENTKSE